MVAEWCSGILANRRLNMKRPAAVDIEIEVDECYNSASCSEQKNKRVNNCIKLTDEGQYKYLTDRADIINEDFGKDYSKALPETLAAQRACTAGECELLQEGLRFYKWRELKGGRQWKQLRPSLHSNTEQFRTMRIHGGGDDDGSCDGSSSMEFSQQWH